MSNTVNGNPAERAGRAAKTARRLRRDRERVVGLAGAVVLAIPLLFAAVWTRNEVSRELRDRDALYAERDSLETQVMLLSWKESRLTGWEALQDRLGRTGLRPPKRDEVQWVNVDPSRRKGG
ncbi:MAG TPA: hypothetical protein VKU85_10525 [bacterium]|nr:hypothetical protein [bacterium]